MLVFEILRLASLLMECSCIAPLTHDVMVMRGLVFHMWFRMFSISGLYLACLCVRACSGNMSWQYVNSMSGILWVGEGSIGVDVWVGAPRIFRISGHMGSMIDTHMVPSLP